jgi:hypothetical protein
VAFGCTSRASRKTVSISNWRYYIPYSFVSLTILAEQSHRCRVRNERGKRDLSCDMRILVLLLHRSDCEGCETKVAVVKSRESLVSLAFVYEAFTGG